LHDYCVVVTIPCQASLGAIGALYCVRTGRAVITFSTRAMVVVGAVLEGYDGSDCSQGSEAARFSTTKGFRTVEAYSLFPWTRFLSHCRSRSLPAPAPIAKPPRLESLAEGSFRFSPMCVLSNPIGSKAEKSGTENSLAAIDPRGRRRESMKARHLRQGRQCTSAQPHSLPQPEKTVECSWVDPLRVADTITGVNLSRGINTFNMEVLARQSLSRPPPPELPVAWLGPPPTGQGTIKGYDVIKGQL